MKSILPLIAICAVPALHAATVESPIPSVLPAERYEALIAKSPFALATPAAAPPAVPEKSFADGWFVSGLAQLGGKDFVTIKARDLSAQFQLFGNEPNDNGVSLQKVEWSPTIGHSTVTIAKDGQSAKLEFNQADLQTAPSAPAGAPNQSGMARPNIPVMSNAGPKPNMPRPTQPVMQPQQFNGQLNANPAGQLPRPNGMPVPVPAPDPRRRIRVINTNPVQ